MFRLPLARCEAVKPWVCLVALAHRAGAPCADVLLPPYLLSTRPLVPLQGGRAGSAKDSHVLQNAECYSLADGCWAPLPAMAAPRTALGAAALRGAVYAVGGQSDRATHATAEWFEPGHGAWSLLGAPMKEPRKYLGAAALGGEWVDVLVGGRLERLGSWCAGGTFCCWGCSETGVSGLRLPVWAAG